MRTFTAAGLKKVFALYILRLQQKTQAAVETMRNISAKVFIDIPLMSFVSFNSMKF